MLGCGDVGGVARNLAVRLVARPQAIEQLLGNLPACKLACRVDGVDISHLADLGQVGFARQ
ncbi:hypothetical protein D3C73_1611390 [compost metagenome]